MAGRARRYGGSSRCEALIDVIAASLSANDWWNLRKAPSPRADHALWKRAFDDYHRQRLSLRNLEPIKALQDNGTFQGEGFSIVAIQCTLIEFLASTIKGKNCRRWPKKGEPPLSGDDYANSGDMFVRFLSEQSPFQQLFSREKLNAHMDQPFLVRASCKRGHLTFPAHQRTIVLLHQCIKHRCGRQKTQADVTPTILDDAQ